MLPLLLQAVTPPPAIPARAAPPMVTVAPPERLAPVTIVGHDHHAAPPVTLEIDVAAEGRTLWSGPLRVAQGASSSYRQDRQEPPAVACPGERHRNRVGGTGLQVNLSANEYGENAAETFSLTVRWSRVTEAPCPFPTGVRNVELTQVVRLAPGGTITLGGDAGLTVRLRRPAR